MGFGFMGGGLLFLLAVIIIPIVLLANHTGSNNGQNNVNQSLNSSDRALDILNGRYARGEITDEEYRVKKEALLRK